MRQRKKQSAQWLVLPRSEGLPLSYGCPTDPLSERRFVLLAFTHMSPEGCVRLYEAGH